MHIHVKCVRKLPDNYAHEENKDTNQHSSGSLTL